MKRVIPVYSLNDFLTDEPYKFLCYGAFDSEFERLSAESAVAENAKNCGFKAFDKMLKAFRQGMMATDGDLSESDVTTFGLDIEPLYCGQYICSRDGVSIPTKDGQKMVFPHPIFPSRIFRNVDTDEVNIEVSFMVNGMLRKRVVPKEMLSSTQKIIGLSNYGVMVNSGNASNAVAYFADMETLNAGKIPYEECISHLGWIEHEERFSPYCGVTYDDSDRDSRRIFDGMLCPSGTLDAWLDVAKEVRIGKRLPAKIALAATFAAPLVKPLGCLCFMVHMHGDSGCGKTVALHMAASAWVDPRASGFIKSFDSTKVGRELHAAFCNSVPVIIDETQLANKKDGMDGTVYALCEGISRTKGTKDGGTVLQKRWSTVIITSGENSLSSLSSGTGAVARVIDAEFGGEDLFDDNVRIANTVQKNYGHAGKGFIEWLTDGNMEKVKTWYNEYIALIGKTVQDKQAMAAACILTADKAYTACFGLDAEKSLTVADILPCLVTKEEADLNARTHRWVKSLIAMNRIRFDKDPEINKGELWGIKELNGNGNRVFFIAAKLEELMQNNGYNYGAYTRWAKRNGKIRCLDDRRVTVRKTIGGEAGIACVEFINDKPEEKMPWEVV